MPGGDGGVFAGLVIKYKKLYNQYYIQY